MSMLAKDEMQPNAEGTAGAPLFVALLHADDTGRWSVEDVSPGWAARLPFSAEQLLGDPSGGSQARAPRVGEANAWQERIRRGEAVDVEADFADASGGRRRYRLAFRPLPGQAGSRAVLVAEDVHEQRETDRALSQQRTLSRLVADAIPALIIVSVANPKGEVEPVYFNRRFEEYTGLTETELLGPQRNRIYAPEDRRRIQELRRDAAAPGGTTGEFRFRRFDGEYRWHSMVHRPVDLEDGSPTIYVTAAIEVHERRQAEEARARLAAIVDSSHDAIVGKTLDGTITSWNLAAERLFGYTAAAAIGQHIDIIVPPERQEEAAAVRDRVARKETVEPFETVRRSRDGREVAISLRVSPILDRDGDVVGLSTIARDVSRERALVADLERANSVKDEFLSFISHELRTPLTAVVGLSTQLERRLEGADPETRAIATDTSAYAQRLNRTVENMLILRRLGTDDVELEPLLLHRLVEQQIEQHRKEHPGCEVVIEAERDLPPVDGHPGWADQILENLLTNAEKYSPEGQPITVELRSEGDGVVLAVADRGRGIPAEDFESLFEPFFRSKAHQNTPGIGLGLAVCRRLAELQRGRIGAANRAGGGAVFSVWLPASDLS